MLFEGPLILAGLAMGAAASPHCAAMCGAPCAMACRGGRPQAWGFHAGRVAGYMAAGALAAVSFGTVTGWMVHSPLLRPLWTMLHLAFLALGLWWLATGRHPVWLERRTQDATVKVVAAPARRGMRSALARLGRSFGIGLAWVAWPCAALQAALLLAAMASGAVGGALVMGAYALASLPALAAVPWLSRRWQAVRAAASPGAASPAATSAGAVPAALFGMWGLRLGGLVLAASSLWALGHGVWHQVVAWCS